MTYLSSEEKSIVRLVCHGMFTICASQLNSTFKRIQRQVTYQLKSISRERSARRPHPLGPKQLVIGHLEIRISMLHSVFRDYIEKRQTCFYPGKILDKILCLWRSIPSATTTDKHLLEELIILMDMAMQHFSQNIEPSLHENEDSPYPFFLRCYPSKHTNNGQKVPNELDTRPCDTAPDLESHSINELEVVKSELRDYKSKVTNQSNMITELTRNVDTSNKRFNDLSETVQSLLTTFHRHGFKQGQQSSETLPSGHPAPTPRPHVPKNLPAIIKGSSTWGR